ncbi:MAG: hypothetical protein MUO26_09035 [Methanotrichaceae archaeon]|nr:hypothetical protein [Methanotrichaceae archaeon]
MANSTQLAEFTVSKDRLIQALACVSNIADKAVVRAIVHPKDVILGVAFSNMLSEGASDHELYADYVIVEEEMISAKFLVKSEDWPIFYISCAEQFIDSVATLQPRDSEFLKVAFYSEEEKPDMLKSEVLILGEHNSAVGSILRHPSSREGSTTLEADETQSILYR